MYHHFSVMTFPSCFILKASLVYLTSLHMSVRSQEESELCSCVSVETLMSQTDEHAFLSLYKRFKEIKGPQI